MPSTETYPLSLHDALPICALPHFARAYGVESIALRYFNAAGADPDGDLGEHHDPEVHVIPKAIDAALGRGSFQLFGDDYDTPEDRKSTRLNSSYSQISYAVHRDLPSFPTRRSSDLRAATLRARLRCGVDRAALLQRRRRRPRRRSGRASRPGSARHTQSHRRGAGARVVPAFRRRLRHAGRSEEHTSELQLQSNLVCRPPRPTLFPYTTLFRSARCHTSRAPTVWSRSRCATSTPPAPTPTAIWASITTRKCTSYPKPSTRRWGEGRSSFSATITTRRKIGRAHV